MVRKLRLKPTHFCAPVCSTSHFIHPKPLGPTPCISTHILLLASNHITISIQPTSILVLVPLSLISFLHAIIHTSIIRNINPKRNPAFHFIFIVHNARSSPGNSLAQNRDSKEEVGGRCNDTARLLGCSYKMPPKVCAKEKAKKNMYTMEQ